MVSEISGEEGVHSTAKKNVTILGATGSIGLSTLDVIGQHQSKFEITALVSQSKVEELANLAIQFKASFAVIQDKTKFDALKTRLKDTNITPLCGDEGINTALDQPADIVVAAIVGAQGLAPTIYAMRSQPNRRLALANKECLVSAGHLFMSEAKANLIELLPVDSEHNALFQCMVGQDVSQIEKLVLTASGGPFLNTPIEELENVRVKEALNHPVWSMGSKISIDSATMMNKGLELIEARHLFNKAPEKLEALIHPQSIVHGMVHYKDGSVLAQMGIADMRVPISYSLGLPSRLPLNAAKLDLLSLPSLEFREVDLEKFPCFSLAFDAMKIGEGATNCLNAANEIAVQNFLNGAIAYQSIYKICEKVITQMHQSDMLGVENTLEAILAQDAHARQLATTNIATL